MRALPLLLLLILTACAPRFTPQAARTPLLNPAGPPPDVVILAVSGRCSPPCLAPRDNVDYLSARGTLDALADVFAARGLNVQVSGYASHPAAQFRSPFISADQRGYAALQADLNAIKPWLRGPRPPRLVLLGHSQGAVWLHHLTRVNPDVTFDVQVDLDAICVGWRSDFRTLLRGRDQTPSLLEACDQIQVNGARRNIKDVVWPNVTVNLEVQSKRYPARSGTGGLPVNYLFDLSGNTRLDGTSRGLQLFVSSREDHSAVTTPHSDALAWVNARLTRVVQAWEPALPSAQPAQPLAQP
ncbi:hypothetical protein [Deinococcus knuensis]|uniref:Alpha/beta hydrolase n=1 Tax=Deinococcus knuensis TaxID=1837380 RepID=A0ABQ2SFT3_9DEIO|nr:hypothetical protein [Deinococcus knuensis]GGS17960.1 hypothetical protein GCM10008961_06810 [Deinococcus knuensis]